MTNSLRLTLLDLSRNSLDSSIVNSLIDTVFVKKAVPIETLDLSYNQLTGRQNQDIYKLYLSSSACKSMKLKLEPLPPIVTVPVNREAAVVRLKTQAITEDITIVPKAEKCSERVMGKNSGKRFKIEEPPVDESGIETMEIKTPNFKQPDKLFHLKIDEDLKTQHLASLDPTDAGMVLKALEFLNSQHESIDLPKILDLVATLMSKNIRVCDHFDPDSVSKISPLLEKELHSAHETLDVTLCDHLLTCAEGLGLKAKYSKNPELKGMMINLQGRYFSFLKELNDLFNFRVADAAINDKLDSLVERATEMSLRGTGIDLLFLLREERNKLLHGYFHNGVQDYNVKLEVVKQEPLFFTMLNKQHMEETKAVELDDETHNHFGVHENWLDYEALSVCKRKELIDILSKNDDLLSPVPSTLMMSSLLKRTKLDSFKVKRIAFLLREEETVSFCNFRIDGLLCLARLICKYRWAHGTKQISQYEQINSLKSSYLLNGILAISQLKATAEQEYKQTYLKAATTLIRQENDLRKDLDSYHMMITAHVDSLYERIKLDELIAKTELIKAVCDEACYPIDKSTCSDILNYTTDSHYFFANMLLLNPNLKVNEHLAKYKCQFHLLSKALHLGAASAVQGLRDVATGNCRTSSWRWPSWCSSTNWTAKEARPGRT